MWRKKILPYFQYTKKERAGILVLMVIVLLLWIIPYFFSDQRSPVSEAEITIIKDSVNQFREPGDASGTYSAGDYRRHENIAGNNSPAILFPFDPNQTNTEDWIKLGLQKKTITIIQHYIEKGGRFRKTEDLQKVYALRHEDYLRLKPYVRINQHQTVQKGKAFQQNYQERSDSFYQKKYQRKELQSSELPSSVDVNKADRSAFEKFNGIGEKLAARIILFRDRLGGFHSVDQVGETFGIAPELFGEIRSRLRVSENFEVKKIDINSADPERLKLHPYIGAKLASMIAAYRNQHGIFKDLGDLKKIPVVNDELFMKLSVYLIAGTNTQRQ